MNVSFFLNRSEFLVNCILVTVPATNFVEHILQFSFLEF